MREGHAVACRLRIATLAVPAVLLTLAQTLWAGSAPAAAKPASGSIIGRLLPVDAEAEVAVQDVSRNGLFVARISVTSLDGSYRIDGIPPGEYGVTFTAPGYQPDGPTVRLRPGETLDLGTVTLKPIPPSPLAKGAAPARIVGRLLPAVKARIHVIRRTMMRDDEIREVIAKADATAQDGAFRIEGISPGTYDVEIRASGRVAQAKSVTLESEQTLDLGTVTLAPAGAIAGHITCPVPADAVVIAESRGLPPAKGTGGMAFVDPQTGNYVLEGLPEGVYDLTIEAGGYRKVVGIENHVTQPQELSAADRAGIEAALAALDKAYGDSDFLAALRLYSRSFHDDFGPYERVREDQLRWAVQHKEERKRGLAQGTQATTSARSQPARSRTIERILYGHGEATVICRITELWPDPKKGGTRRIESPRVWGLRKENGAWRFTFVSCASGEPVEALTWDPHVSGIKVVAGQVSRGHDWTLVPLPPARTGE
jgi:hypothetical protein